MQHGDLNCQFQLANWDVQEPAPEAWSCAAGGVPVEYVSIDMIGNCNLQPYLPQSCQGHGGQELAEYYSYYAAASLPNWPIAEVINWQNRQVMGISSKQAVELQNEETNKISNNSLVSAVFEQVSDEFQADIDLMEQKMHRYPASLRDRLHESYTVPRVVAIDRPLPSPPTPPQAGGEGQAHGCHKLRHRIWPPSGGGVSRGCPCSRQPCPPSL